MIVINDLSKKLLKLGIGMADKISKAARNLEALEARQADIHPNILDMIYSIPFRRFSNLFSVCIWVKPDEFSVKTNTTTEMDGPKSIKVLTLGESSH